MSDQLSGLALRKPWQPGQSGNYRGYDRAHRATIRKCRIASPEMAQRLIDCANDRTAPWAARISAAVSVLDRAWGKPKEQVELHNESGVPMLTLRFIDPHGVAADETVTITMPQEALAAPPGAPAPDDFTLSFGKRK